MLTDLAANFPNLVKHGYRRTSAPTSDYNCLAWALNDMKKWWEPDPFGFCFWPHSVRRTYSLESYVGVCREYGYTVCADGSLESGFEKVVIYTTAGEFRHIARQLPDGAWTSKLGSLDDIRHSLDGVVGPGYGQTTVFLKRGPTA